MPKLELDDAFASKEDVATAVQRDLKAQMEEYGYEIVNTLITDIDPAPAVKAAMNDINGTIKTS